MQKQNLTLKVLSEKANCAPFIVKYLYSCRRLPVIKESLGSGYPVIFHPDAINYSKSSPKQSSTRIAKMKLSFIQELVWLAKSNLNFSEWCIILFKTIKRRIND